MLRFLKIINLIWLSVNKYMIYIDLEVIDMYKMFVI